MSAFPFPDFPELETEEARFPELEQHAASSRSRLEEQLDADGMPFPPPGKPTMKRRDWQQLADTLHQESERPEYLSEARARALNLTKEALAHRANLTLQVLEQDARQGKSWPPASPYLTKVLDEQIHGLKDHRARRDAARSANQTPQDLSSDDQVLEMAENLSREAEPFHSDEI